MCDDQYAYWLGCFVTETQESLYWQSWEHHLGIYPEACVCSFPRPKQRRFSDPKSRPLHILGLEQLGHRLKVIIVKVESETPRRQTVSLLGACRLVAITFLRRTSRPRQLLTDKQQATSCQKLKITIQALSSKGSIQKENYWSTMHSHSHLLHSPSGTLHPWDSSNKSANA